MADSKTKYSTTVSKVKKISSSSKKLSRKLAGGEARAEKYKNGWQGVNLNELIAKVVPNAIVYESNGKIVFSNGGMYIVIADVVGGYCRIQNLDDTSENPYMSLNLTPYDEPPKVDKERLTHFRIKKREEM